MSKSGYTSVSRTVTVTAGSTTYVSATLGSDVPETGTLYIVSTPQGARTFVDDVYYGKTPALASGLTEGDHQVRISLSGFQEWIGTVNVEGGSTKTVSQTLPIGTLDPDPDSRDRFCFDLFEPPRRTGVYRQCLCGDHPC